MLTDKDIAILNNCLLDDHLLLEVELNVVKEESAELRDRFNSGDKLTCSELMALPYSESLAVKKITDKNDIQWLTAYAIANGRDLQSLFETSEFNYLTLFIDNENVSSQFKEWLIAYDLLDAFQSSKATGITISYPEKSKTNKSYGWDIMRNQYLDNYKNNESNYDTLEIEDYMTDESVGRQVTDYRKSTNGRPLLVVFPEYDGKNDCSSIRKDDDNEDTFALARDVSDQLSIIVNALDKDNAQEIIVAAAGEIQSLIQKDCIDRSH